LETQVLMNDFFSTFFGGLLGGAPATTNETAAVPEWVMLDETLMVRFNAPPPPPKPIASEVKKATGVNMPINTPPEQFQGEMDVPSGGYGKKYKHPTGWQGEGDSEFATDASGRFDPVAFHKTMEAKVAASHLNGYVPKDGAQFGIKTGAPREWARLFSMIVQQESGHRVAQKNPDGSLRRFASTIATEKSFGPGQFNIGEYGLKTWDDVNNPARVGDALINAAKKLVVDSAGAIRGAGNTGLAAYFGSIRRPNETLQHAPWWDRLVRPHLE
jgi:hypothetical protein